MQHATLNGAIDYRHGEWGPAYLMRHGGAEIGVVALRPGDHMENHFHERCHESFVIVEGEVTLWTAQAVRTVLRTGDIASCPPGEHHYLENESSSLCRLVFLKTPPSPGDTTVVAWAPTER